MQDKKDEPFGYSESHNGRGLSSKELHEKLGAEPVPADRRHYHDTAMKHE